MKTLGNFKFEWTEGIETLKKWVEITYNGLGRESGLKT